MQKRHFGAMLVLCVALLLPVSGWGQTANATLGGSVTDSTGALLPGVEITATNTGTGIVSTTVTNESGAYNFPSLQNGEYTVMRTCPDFRAVHITMWLSVFPSRCG